MTGIDTCFLVDLEVRESPRHEGARAVFEEWKEHKNEVLAVYDHVFLEFAHILSDPKRFERPLSMDAALARAHFWMRLERVRVVSSTVSSFEQARLWMTAFHLGRKRIIDTHLAAAYREAGARTLITTNADDFRLFDAFELRAY